MSQSDPLRALRSQIDDLNGQIVHLLNQRARVALEIAKLKNQRGDDLYAPEREEAVYKQLTEINSGPLPPEALKNIFREIMRGTLLLQGSAHKRAD